MLELIGQLGIDPRLLIAQIVNFLILLWILKILVYKPILRRIEEEENVFRQADKLKKDEELFNERKQAELRELREQSRLIIEKAEHVAVGINNDSREEARKNIDRITASAEKLLASQKESISDRIEKKAMRRFGERLHERLKGVLPENTQEALRAGFFEKLLGEVLSLKKAELMGDPKAVLYSAEPFSEKDRKRLKTAMKKVYGKEVGLTEHRNPDLVSGYRLEIGGFVITADITDAITYAEET